MLVNSAKQSVEELMSLMEQVVRDFIANSPIFTASSLLPTLEGTEIDSARFDHGSGPCLDTPACARKAMYVIVFDDDEVAPYEASA